MSFLNHPRFQITFLAVIIIGLFLLRYEALFLPYHWDEAWAYGPAVHTMTENGPSLIPRPEEEVFTRGHPLMFHFLCSSFLYLFGNTNFNAHLFSFLISSLFVLSFFYFSRKIFNVTFAYLGTLLLVSSPFFLGQTVMVYSEILLCLFGILTIKYFLEEKWILFFMSSSAMILTKESGVILLFSIYLWAIIKEYFFRKTSILSRRSVLLQCYFIIPLLPLLLFFIYKYFAFGYMLFPEHIGYINYSLEAINDKMKLTYNILFSFQSKEIPFYVCIAIFILFNTRFPLVHRIILFLLGFTFTKTLFILWDAGLTVPLLLLTIIIIYLILLNIFKRKEEFSFKDDLFNISCIFVLLYSFFISIYFFADRYLFILVPIIILILLNLLFYTSRKEILGSLVTLCFLGFNIHYLATTQNSEERNMHYSFLVNQNKALVEYLENNNFYAKRIYAPFVITTSLKIRYAWFRTTKPEFINIGNDLTNSELYIWNKFENPKDELLFSNTKKFKLLKTFKQGNVEIRLYEKIVKT